MPTNETKKMFNTCCTDEISISRCDSDKIHSRLFNMFENAFPKICWSVAATSN